MTLSRRMTILIGYAILLLPVSCSIKEDRSACPCFIHVDWTAVLSDERLAARDDSALVIMRGLHNDLVSVSAHSDGYSFNVRRTPSLFSCYMGMSGDRLQSGRGRLVIPSGEDSDRLFSYHRMLRLDAGTEEEFVTPSLCCECTRVILRYDEESGEVPQDDKTFVATSSTCGLDLGTGEPLEGEFTHTLEVCDSRSWTFNMPRQKGKDIRIDAFSTVSGERIFGIDLSRELDSAGYDWDAESLPPLVIVNISRQNLPVDLRIIDWDEAVYFNCTL